MANSRVKKAPTPKKKNMTTVDAYRMTFGDADYSVQNMLVRQADFPAEYFDGDVVDSEWNDRARINFEMAHKQHFPEGTEGTSRNWVETMRHMPQETFLAWCKVAVYGDTGNIRAQLTGARLVRFTNASSGYPAYRVDVFTKGKDTPRTELYNRMGGPLVIHYEDALSQFRVSGFIGTSGEYWL